MVLVLFCSSLLCSFCTFQSHLMETTNEMKYSTKRIVIPHTHTRSIVCMSYASIYVCGSVNSVLTWTNFEEKCHPLALFAHHWEEEEQEKFPLISGQSFSFLYTQSKKWPKKMQKLPPKGNFQPTNHMRLNFKKKLNQRPLLEFPIDKCNVWERFNCEYP